MVDGVIVPEVDCDWVVSGGTRKVTHSLVKAPFVERHPVHELADSRVVHDPVAGQALQLRLALGDAAFEVLLE